MKKIITSLFIFGFVILATRTASAQMGMADNMQTTSVSSSEMMPEQSLDVQAAVKDILKGQNVNNESQLNCSEISDDQYFNLGQAYMANGLTEQEHNAMNAMMGGKGSPTLRQAHINLGRSYIGCFSNYNASPMMGSNGKGMSMQGTRLGFWGNLFSIFSLILMGSGIAAFVKYLMKK